jgi:hypothetical protein
MEAKQKQAGWGFWLLWVAASTIGIFLGFIPAFSIGALIYYVGGDALADVFMGMVLGVGVGTMQWLVLRRHMPGTGWWIPATALAGFGMLAAAIGAFGIPRATLAATGIAVAFGAATGALQWLILRKKVAWAGWWIPACATSWGLGLLVVNTTPFGGGDGGAILAIVTGVTVPGAITGGTMVWLLRQRKNNKEK